MQRKTKERQDQQGADPKGQRVQNPIEERSPNNQASGWKDFDDYRGPGALPVGDAPVHAAQKTGDTVDIGVELNQDAANPGGRSQDRSRHA